MQVSLNKGTKKLFKECTRCRNWIIYSSLGIFSFTTALKGLDYLVSSPPSYLNAGFLFLSSLAAATLMWWLRRLKLKVTITDNAIKYKLHPLHKSKRKILWRDVTDLEVVKTSQAAQWSGANIHFSREEHISLTGRNGLAIQTRSGRRYFIGCQNVDQLSRTLADALG